jgi:DNA-binding NtrC family response regulator
VAQHNQEARADATSSARVLVVDDEADGLALIRAALERRGQEVVALTSPLEALDRVVREDFDVLLTDLSMDELGGIELCERVLEARPDMPIVVVTGHGSLPVAIEAMRAGAYDFVTKPVEPEALTRAVARAAHRRHVHDQVHRLASAAALTPAGADELGSSAIMRAVHELATRVASCDVSVLIQGETGTGKELVARALYAASGTKGRFVALNCAAVSHSLLESELFGHAKGAFTDAHAQHDGLFVQASGGMIFLDEVAELPLDLQPKLLRVLQERKVRPVGSNAEVPFQTRLVTATNRDLAEEVREKRFREDLYYRINVVTLKLPALRDRGADVVELAAHFLAQIGKRTGKPILKLSSGAAEKLLAYAWPGNVRELENCMERAAVMARFDAITVADLPDDVRGRAPRRLEPGGELDPDAEGLTVSELERRHIGRVLARVGDNKTRAARILGMDRRTLYRKLDGYRGRSVT